MTDERQLLELIRTRAVVRGPVKLACGELSDYYLDARLVSMDGDGAALIGKVLRERTMDLYPRPAFGGLECGGIPLAVACVAAFQAAPDAILWKHAPRGFWVRKKPKFHGRGRLIEGPLEPGADVVLLEDVVTTGASVLKAAAAVRSHGCRVLKVVALVDRQGGGAALLEEAGVPYEPLFSVGDCI